jgi:anti-sigma B factor antagonist
MNDIRAGEEVKANYAATAYEMHDSFRYDYRGGVRPHRFRRGKQCSARESEEPHRPGKKKIVLSMNGIEYIDSSGLGILVAAHLSAKNHGASLRLCHLGRKFQEVLHMTKLATIFQVCNTEAAAFARFSK